MKAQATALDYLAAVVVLLGSGMAVATRNIVWAVVAFAGLTLLMRRWLRDQ